MSEQLDALSSRPEGEVEEALGVPLEYARFLVDSRVELMTEADFGRALPKHEIGDSRPYYGGDLGTSFTADPHPTSAPTKKIAKQAKTRRGRKLIEEERRRAEYNSCAMCKGVIAGKDVAGGVIEGGDALRLPCRHLVGQCCLERWGTPAAEAGTGKCPVCSCVIEVQKVPISRS